jgi:transposase InsO family protein
MRSRGRCWAPPFSPHGTFSEVPPTDVQADFRQRFARWGLPQRVRVDNGNPWGNWNDLPTALALWLIGLGVQMRWNDPGRPQQNGKVERSQGTGKRWTEPHRCQDVAELQAHFDQMDLWQRERYPAVGGRSRGEAFPELAQVRQRYTRGWEQRHWDLTRAVQHLAGYVAARRVSRSGHVSVYDHGY